MPEQVRITAHDDLDRRERHELLGIGQELVGEDVPVGEEIGDPEEGFTQRVDPLQVLVKRQLQDVLATRRDRGRFGARVGEVALARGEQRERLQEVGVLEAGERRLPGEQLLGLDPVVVEAKVCPVLRRSASCRLRTSP